MGVQPLAEVEDQYVHVHMEYVSQDEGQVAAILAEGIRTLEWHLSVMAKAAEPWNLTLPNDARARIQARKDRLLRDRGLAETLGFPIRKRQTSLPTYSLDVRKKIGVPDLERSSTAPFAPQLCLSMSAYEEILSVIQRMSEVMERSPSSFAGIDEEGLRSHFLASLNGSFETDSTGETFNAGGKTDIFLRSNGGNAFVAECKMWKGQGAVPGIIDQLLGYVTWRDTKTAVLLFNRNKGFSEVLGKARLAAEKHPMFKRSLPYEIANGYRGVYSHPDDPNREVTITTLIFDVPIKDF